jgi:hypothetical protein
VRVFRVWRDDDYLGALLRVLGVLRARHVAPGAPPAASQFLAAPGQAEALARTAELARRAEVVAEPGCAAAAGGGGGGLEAEDLHPPACEDGSNVAAFWV